MKISEVFLTMLIKYSALDTNGGDCACPVSTAPVPERDSSGSTYSGVIVIEGCRRGAGEKTRETRMKYTVSIRPPPEITRIPDDSLIFKNNRTRKQKAIFFFSYTINSSERQDYVPGLMRQDMRVQTAFQNTQYVRG